MPEPVFWSDDGRFGIKFSDDSAAAVIRECTRSDGIETGGILIGLYTSELDCAIVTRVTGPPEDSVRTRTTFYRGVRGLQVLINRLWKGPRQYYLGEWHFHPGAPAEPSREDRQHMTQIAGNKKYNCPEPVLVIVGGSPGQGFHMRAFVFVRDGHPKELAEKRDGIAKGEVGGQTAPD